MSHGWNCDFFIIAIWTSINVYLVLLEHIRWTIHFKHRLIEYHKPILTPHICHVTMNQHLNQKLDMIRTPYLFPNWNSLQIKRGLSKKLSPYWEEREDKRVINFQSMKVYCHMASFHLASFLHLLYHKWSNYFQVCNLY